MNYLIEKNIIIDKDPASIWQMLTIPGLMKQCTGEPEMRLEIHTDWTVNSPIIMTAFITPGLKTKE